MMYSNTMNAICYLRSHRTPRFPCAPLLITTCAALAWLPTSASAASVTIETGPSSSTIGSVVENSNSFTFSQVSPAWVKVTGVGQYTATGDTSAIILDVGGFISAQTGESISLDYDFTFAITGAGEINWTLTSLLFGFISGPSASGGPITIADSGNVTGTESAGVTFTADNVSWSAKLTANWTGAANGDTLSVTIPENSIDIAVVPEPSAFLLLGLTGIMTLRRKR